MRGYWWRATLNSSGKDAVLAAGGRRFQSLMVRGKKECPWMVDFGPGVLQLVLQSRAQVVLAEWGPQILFDGNVISQYLVHKGTYWFFATSGEVIPSEIFQMGLSHWLGLVQGLIFFVGCSSRIEQHVAERSRGAWCHKRGEGQWLLRRT